MKKQFVWICLVVLVLGTVSSAGARRGPKPYTLEQDVADFSGIAHHVLATPDLDKIMAKELRELERGTKRLRVAETIRVGSRMSALAGWQLLPDGSHLWRARFSSPGAYFLSFQLSGFELPRWGTMHVVSVEHDYYDGSYTIRNNNQARAFASPMVPGQSAVLEVRIPAGAEFADFRLDAVSYGYRNALNVLSVPLREGQRPIPRKDRFVALKAVCDTDVNCPEGNAWQEEKRSVARIFDGNFLCSGALVNSTDNDCVEYHMVSAKHCFSSGKAKNLVFYWNYENSVCGGNDASLGQTTTGSTHLMSHAGSDFFLARLNEIPPEAFTVSKAGFEASGAFPQSGAGIHHADGGPKLISLENDPLIEGQKDGWGDDHWRVTGWDVGGTAPGSSGSAFFDENHRHVGQLTGGAGECGDGWDEYGKLSDAWTAGALAHLDPGNTGATATDLIRCFGGEPPPPPPPPPPCELGAPGDPCTANSDCCSNKCKGKPGAKTCS